MNKQKRKGTKKVIYKKISKKSQYLTFVKFPKIKIPIHNNLFLSRDFYHKLHIEKIGFNLVIRGSKEKGYTSFRFDIISSNIDCIKFDKNGNNSILYNLINGDNLPKNHLICDEINTFIESHLESINNNNNHLKTNNNLKNLLTNSRKYPINTNIRTSGLLSKLKSIYGAWEIKTI